MLISKASLQTVEIISSDKSIPALDNIHILPNGTTIACNGRCVVAVSPIPDETAVNVPIEQTPSITSHVTLSSDTARKVVKAIGRDTLFDGLLEYCDLRIEGNRVLIDLKDGERSSTIEGQTFFGKYINWRDWFKFSKPKQRIVLNRRRLLALLKTLEHICPDSSGEFPIFMEFLESGAISIRGVNFKNGQRVVAIMGSYSDNEGKWLEADDWEKSLGLQKVPKNA